MRGRRGLSGSRNRATTMTVPERGRKAKTANATNVIAEWRPGSDCLTGRGIGQVTLRSGSVLVTA